MSVSKKRSLIRGTTARVKSIKAGLLPAHSRWRFNTDGGGRRGLDGTALSDKARGLDDNRGAGDGDAGLLVVISIGGLVHHLEVEIEVSHGGEEGRCLRKCG